MPKAPKGEKPKKAPKGEKPEVNEAEDTKPAKAGKAEAVAVYDGQTLVRVYSLADHGEDYKDLAKQFVDHPARSGYRIEAYVPPPTPEEIAEEDTEKVKVLTENGQLVREYSLRDHGEEYRALAEQFVKKYEARKYKLG